MELITLTKENLEKEHICCAISNNKDCQVAAKKEWIAKRLDDGLVFLKGDVRGKCFIEYIPAEKAWAPINAENYMYIDCFWVSGQFKGHGYGDLLLEACIKDSKAKGKSGLVVLSSEKKLPFLSEPAFLKYKGFKLADDAAPYFKLFYLPFDEKEPLPQFKEHVKTPHTDKEGFVIYYAHQCPFTAKYIPLLEQIAKDKNVPFTAVRFETTEQAQSAPSPFTSFGLFFNGEFLTHTQLSEKAFEKLLAEKGF